MKIQLRRGTATRWQEVNPTLAVAEVGTESDTGRWKLGDGVTPWQALPYQPSATDVAGFVSTADPRLSDARPPTAHTHPATAISDSTAVGRSVLTAADAPAVRAAIGAGTSSLTLGTTSTTAAAGNDARLSDTRTPKAHASTHATGGADALTPANIGAAPAGHTHAATAISDSTAVGRSVLTAADAAAARTAIGAGTSSLVIGTTSTTAAAGNDARLSDARTPKAHTHPIGDLTATGTKDATTFLSGDGTWKVPPTGAIADTGWQPLALTAPVVTGSAGARSRVRGGVCYYQIHGSYTGSYGDGFVVATLPVAPTAEHWPVGLFAGGAGEAVPFRVNINTAGQVVLQGRGVSAAGFTLSGSFPQG